MAKPRKSNAGAQPLSFPNPSRSYDATTNGVRFWGYDGALEVSFFIEENALAKISPRTKANQGGLLNIFGANRDRICTVAANIYSRRRKASHIFSYTLTDSDF